ncbi:hypothetical protein GGI07_001155 [Coemansia sp. Benny D115]|nr:hypothetical protein GGI07_001155 [Coemansia sp. Benny D115]
MYTDAHHQGSGSGSTPPPPPPPQQQQPSTQTKQKDIPLLRSCERCRRRKQKCDGVQPVCGRCISHGSDCNYRQSGRFRKRFPRTKSAEDDENNSPPVEHPITPDHRGQHHPLSQGRNLLTQGPVQGQSQSQNQSQSQSLSHHITQGHSQLKRQRADEQTKSEPNLRTVATSAVPARLSDNAPLAAEDTLLSAATALSALSSIAAMPTPGEPRATTAATLGSLPSPAPPWSAPPTMTAGLGAFSPSTVPALSPPASNEPSPSDPLISTPATHLHSMLHTAVDPMHCEKQRLDPVSILRTHELPDLAHGLPDQILRSTWELIDRMGERELSPNMELLDPRNTAAHAPNQRYDAAWLADRSRPAASQDAALLNALRGVVGRHHLPADAALLLRLLQREYGEDQRLPPVGALQLRAAMAAGSASDFEVLAHLTLACVAQPAADAAQAADTACYEAARHEWEQGLVAATPGAVCAQLRLSEYAQRTGRTHVHWEFAHIAESTARRMDFRGHRFPWHHARIQPAAQAGVRCDTAYEHVLHVFWAAWSAKLAAAQQLGRRIEPLDTSAAPELPAHDICRITPMQQAVSTRTCAPSNDSDMYAAAHARLALAMAPLADALQDVRDGRSTPALYYAAMRRWDAQQAHVRAQWPHSWLHRMHSILVEPAQPLGLGDALLMQLHMHWEAQRLHVYASALALLHGPLPQGTAAFGPLSRLIVSANVMHPDRHAPPWGFSGVSDPLGEAAQLHRWRYECLDAAQQLQRLLEAAEPRGLSMHSLGAWGTAALDLLLAVHCGRFARLDALTQADTVRRLGVLVGLLLRTRRWAASLVVFTSVVKVFVSPDCCVTYAVDTSPQAPPPLIPQHPARAKTDELTPWPANHVLTLLMREMRMGAREFCALTLPVVYAAVSNASELPASKRVRIQSLIS